VDLKSCPPQVASLPPAFSADHCAGQASAADHEWRERFGKHNVAIGVLLFIWGAIVSAGPPQSGGDKVLASHSRLNAVVNVLQLVTLINAAGLVASGVALRRGSRWGYPLAICCAIVMVCAGGVFFAGLQHLGAGLTLEYGVARISYIRNNFDMLIGLVDGAGLLWFLTTRLKISGLSSAQPNQL
jgi:hypothetical protein